MTTQGPDPSNPLQSTPADIRYTYIGQRHDGVWNHPQPINDVRDPLLGITDLNSAGPSDSLPTEHIYCETFEDVPDVNGADTVVWAPEDELADKETVEIRWNYIDNKDATQYSTQK